MSVAAAFQVLGLPTSSTEDDIRRRYRSLVKSVHSDTSPDQGDDSAFIELQTAYEVALDHKNSTSLIAIDNTRQILESIELSRQSLEKIATLQVATAYREQAVQNREYVRHLATHHTSRYHVLKRTSAIFSGIWTAAATIITLGTTMGNGRLASYVSAPMITLMILVLALMALCSGLLTWHYSITAENLQQDIADLGETLSIKEECSLVFWEIVEEGTKTYQPSSSIEKGWSRETLATLIDNWMMHERNGQQEANPRTVRSFVFALPTGYIDFARFVMPTPATSPRSRTIVSVAKSIGKTDFLRLIVAKCLETRILEPNESTDARGRLIVTYVPIVPSDDETPS